MLFLIYFTTASWTLLMIIIIYGISIHGLFKSCKLPCFHPKLKVIKRCKQSSIRHDHCSMTVDKRLWIKRGKGYYLKDFWEEPRTDFFTEKIVDSCQAGHRTSQCPVRWRPHPVGPVKGMKRFLVFILIHYDGQAGSGSLQRSQISKVQISISRVRWTTNNHLK